MSATALPHPDPDSHLPRARSNKMRKWIWTGGLLIIAAALLHGYYRHHFPYGSTHRCSKILAGYLEEYAHDHGGNYPKTADPSHLGLGRLIEHEPEDSEFVLELVVGKAGDLDRAREFYTKHGYLLPDHSSWQYDPNRTTADEGKAIAWDKIPLGHNGQRLSYNPREVIMVGGYVEQVNEADWNEFLSRQR